MRKSLKFLTLDNEIKYTHKMFYGKYLPLLQNVLCDVMILCYPGSTSKTESIILKIKQIYVTHIQLHDKI